MDDHTDLLRNEWLTESWGIAAFIKLRNRIYKVTKLERHTERGFHFVTK